MKNLYPISLVLCLACVSYAASPATTAASAAPKRLQDAAAFLRNARSYRFATQTRLASRPDSRPSELDAAVRLPDRLRVHREFMGGIDYYFDGKTLSGITVADKQYGSMEAPATIAALLEAEKQRGARLVSGLRFFTFLAHPDHAVWSLPDWKASADQTLGSS